MVAALQVGLLRSDSMATLICHMLKHICLILVCVGMAVVGVVALGQTTMPVTDSNMLFSIPSQWERRGLALPRAAGRESGVSGDPCIVWDDAIGGWPDRNWHFADQPIEWVKDIPKSALDSGEGFNLWRQFIHVQPDGRAELFYNSGYYGKEQLYMKVGNVP
jgi:hypothetical protein